MEMMMSKEGWDSRDDKPYWGCLIFASVFALAWLMMLVKMGVF